MMMMMRGHNLKISCYFKSEIRGPVNIEAGMKAIYRIIATIVPKILYEWIDVLIGSFIYSLWVGICVGGLVGPKSCLKFLAKDKISTPARNQTPAVWTATDYPGS
jgi:hypothetical protein